MPAGGSFSIETQHVTLGLATVHGIRRPADGAAEISSAPGAGANVSAWLPAATSETAAAHAQLAWAPGGHANDGCRNRT